MVYGKSNLFGIAYKYFIRLTLLDTLGVCILATSVYMYDLITQIFSPLAPSLMLVVGILVIALANIATFIKLTLILAERLLT